MSINSSKVIGMSKKKFAIFDGLDEPLIKRFQEVVNMDNIKGELQFHNKKNEENKVHIHAEYNVNINNSLFCSVELFRGKTFAAAMKQFLSWYDDVSKFNVFNELTKTKKVKSKKDQEMLDHLLSTFNGKAVQ